MCSNDNGDSSGVVFYLLCRAVKNIRRLESMVDMVEASQSKQTYRPLDLARISIG
jgi:hypothetical protein